VAQLRCPLCSGRISPGPSLISRQSGRQLRPAVAVPRCGQSRTLQRSTLGSPSACLQLSPPCTRAEDLPPFAPFGAWGWSSSPSPTSASRHSLWALGRRPSATVPQLTTTPLLLHCCTMGTSTSSVVARLGPDQPSQPLNLPSCPAPNLGEGQVQRTGSGATGPTIRIPT
jgi:hypothetical protein